MYSCQGNCIKKNPETNLVEGVKALSGKGTLTLQEGKDQLIFSSHNLDKLKLYFVKSISSPKEVSLFSQGARAGLGFGIGNENLLAKMRMSNLISKEGFSCWLYQDQKKLYIGEEKRFFAADNLLTYNELTTTQKIPIVSSPWTIKLDKVMLFNSMLLLNQQANPPPSATMSTTTGFLNFPV